MEFRTIVEIPKPDFEIEPCEEVLLVGSCFADSIGQRFRENAFPVTLNPYGTMYNPVSVLHTVKRCDAAPDVAFITLGTNHVYRLKETGEIVDNCEKRPQRLFQEEQLTVDECAATLRDVVSILSSRNPAVRIVFTVSPIRYRKYGYHESQLSKAVLLMAVEQVIAQQASHPRHLCYFPAYELVLDELRDYRFYAPDMLHPSQQAVDYIWERLVDTCFSAAAKSFLDEWHPLRQALAHRPFNPDAADYQLLMEKTKQRIADMQKIYPALTVPV